MKANPKVESVKRLSRYDGPSRRGGLVPLIDFNYQTRMETAPKGAAFASSGSSYAPAAVPSLNALTNEVFRVRESRSYLAESAVFGLLGLAVAWPLVSMVGAIVRLMK